MPYIIFQDINDFKNSVSGGVNLSLDMQSLEAKIKLAARRHLTQWLGKAQWDQLVIAASGSPTAAETALLPYVKAVIGPLSLYEYSFIGGVQVTGNGIMRQSSENYDTAYKYQVNEYRDSMLDEGYENIEAMLEFLWANSADYPLWTASTAPTRSRALFINTVAEFRDIYMHSLSRYTFELLRPIMIDVETFALQGCLGKPFFTELKSKILADTLNDDEKELLGIMQKSIANFTIEEAMRRFWVQLKNGVVVQTEKLEPQSSQREGSAGGQAFATKTSHHEVFAERYISMLTEYLTDNIGNFPTYETWVAEQAEAAAEEEAALTDAMSIRYHEECLTKPCGCWGFCYCGRKKPRNGTTLL